MNRNNIVKCYTDNKRTYELFPIVKGNTILPKWLKCIKQDFDSCSRLGIKSNQVSKQTMKSCAGVRDLFSNSYVMRLWSDLEIYIDKEKEYITWYFADKETELVLHEPYQRGEFLPGNDHIIAKIHSPWFIKSNANINWSIIPPLYHDENQRNKIYTMPGVLNFKYQHTSNVFLALKNVTGTHLIKAGTPLSYMVPQTERKLKVSNEHNPKEFQKLAQMDQRFAFEHSYYKKRLNLDKENG